MKAAKEILRFETSKGLVLKADTMGPVEGSPILLLHGGGQTRGSWKDTVVELARLGHRVYALDLRGHGESDHSRHGHYTLDDFSSDVREVIRQIGRNPVLIGASLGGLVSIVVAGECKEPVARGLVLVDVAVRTNPIGVARIQRFMTARRDGFESLDEAADAIARYAPDRARPKSTTGLERNLRKIGNRYHWHWDPRLLDSWLPSYESSGQRLEAAARNLNIPVLLIHASRSDVIGQEEVHHLRELVPHSAYVCVENASHMVVGDRNSQFTQAIVDFLALNVELA
jgi:pimeloyl-ACP methyl ester carboxylesterase